MCRAATGARSYAGFVVTWFERRPQSAEVARPKGRGVPQPSIKVDISSLTPELLHFLGQAAYAELGAFENLARAVSTAPTVSAKEGLSAAAARALAKHHGLSGEIRRRGSEPHIAMAPFVERLDHYRQQTQGADWHELLLSCYLTGGLLDDFFIRLSGGLPREVGARVAHLLGEDSGTGVLVTELQSAIVADPALGSRLAMWGRRLVGDTLLVARSAMPKCDQDAAPDSRIEPVFTELIAAHTRRMDDLGLTA